MPGPFHVNRKSANNRVMTVRINTYKNSTTRRLDAFNCLLPRSYLSGFQSEERFWPSYFYLRKHLDFRNRNLQLRIDIFLLDLVKLRINCDYALMQHHVTVKFISSLLLTVAKQRLRHLKGCVRANIKHFVDYLSFLNASNHKGTARDKGSLT